MISPSDDDASYTNIGMTLHNYVIIFEQVYKHILSKRDSFSGFIQFSFTALIMSDENVVSHLNKSPIA